MKTRTNSASPVGFTLIEIMIVVTIVGLLATIAVSNFIIARDSSRVKVIQSNLRQIDQAKEQWAFEQKQPEGAAVADVSVLQDYFRGGGIHLVVQETYEPNPVGTPPTAVLPPGVKLGKYPLGATIPAP